MFSSDASVPERSPRRNINTNIDMIANLHNTTSTHNNHELSDYKAFTSLTGSPFNSYQISSQVISPSTPSKVSSSVSPSISPSTKVHGIWIESPSDSKFDPETPTRKPKKKLEFKFDSLTPRKLFQDFSPRKLNKLRDSPKKTLHNKTDSPKKTFNQVDSTKTVNSKSDSIPKKVSNSFHSPGIHTPSQGPPVTAYHNQENHQLTCFICLELLHSVLTDELIIELKCGSLTHEQCIIQVLYTDALMSTKTMCFCPKSCKTPLVPKKEICLKKIHENPFVTHDDHYRPMSNKNILNLSNTLKKGVETNDKTVPKLDILLPDIVLESSPQLNEKGLQDSSDRISTSLYHMNDGDESLKLDNSKTLGSAFLPQETSPSFNKDDYSDKNNFFLKQSSKPSAFTKRLMSLESKEIFDRPILSPFSTMSKSFDDLQTPTKLSTKPLPNLPLRSPQIDDLWLSPESVSSYNFKNIGNHRHSKSLTEIHDSIYSQTQNIPSRSSSIVSPILAETKKVFANRCSSIMSTFTMEENTHSNQASILQNRFSISTVDSTTPQISSYKNHTIDTVKNQFIRYLMESFSKLTYTQLIRFGSIRLIDKLSISMDSIKWQELVVALFDNYLVVFADSPLLINMKNVSVNLPVQSVVNLVSNNTEIWLTSVMIKVIEKWVVAISDLSFDFPVELTSSTIEIKIELDSKKRQLPISPTSSESTPTTVNGMSLAGSYTSIRDGLKLSQNSGKLTSTDLYGLKMNTPKLDKQLLRGRLSLRNSMASSSNFDSDVDSDQEEIQNLLLKRVGSGWNDLIQNIDDLITT